MGGPMQLSHQASGHRGETNRRVVLVASATAPAAPPPPGAAYWAPAMPGGGLPDVSTLTVGVCRPQ